MSTAYWCILAAALLPYLWVMSPSRPGSATTTATRAAGLQQDIPRPQANDAQLNAFEAFPAFAASVLMAQFAGVDPARIPAGAGVRGAARVARRVLPCRDRCPAQPGVDGWPCLHRRVDGAGCTETRRGLISDGLPPTAGEARHLHRWSLALATAAVAGLAAYGAFRHRGQPQPTRRCRYPAPGIIGIPAHSRRGRYPPLPHPFHCIARACGGRRPSAGSAA